MFSTVYWQNRRQYENEPSEFFKFGCRPTKDGGPCTPGRGRNHRREPLLEGLKMSVVHARQRQILHGSFSAGWKPILQPSIRFKALAEIYTVQSFAQLCDLKFTRIRYFFSNFAMHKLPFLANALVQLFRPLFPAKLFQAKLKFEEGPLRRRGRPAALKTCGLYLSGTDWPSRPQRVGKRGR